MLTIDIGSFEQLSRGSKMDLFEFKDNCDKNLHGFKTYQQVVN